jgi:hypothetical protein
VTVLVEDTPGAAPDSSLDPDLTHAVCRCSPDTSLCGRNLSDAVVVGEDASEDCVVCVDLLRFPCPRCGETLI